MRVFWTNRALEQLLLIQEQVRQTSEVYAGRVLDRIVGRSEQLVAFPYSGRRVPEYERDDVREVIERPYRLIKEPFGLRAVETPDLQAGEETALASGSRFRNVFREGERGVGTRLA